MKEYTPIRDIAYEYNADDGLSYSSPARGVWNIVHIGTLVPGGHQIYVCPTSCLRGVVLTTAELGAMDRLSTITVGEDNILEGDMEETLHEGVRKVIDSLPVRPRMMMVFTSCIHHFLGNGGFRGFRSGSFAVCPFRLAAVLLFQFFVSPADLVQKINAGFFHPPDII